jgi:hypothetical protein
MTAATLSDNLPFNDDPDECKPCEWCNKPMVRKHLRNRSTRYFRERKACSHVCKQKLKAGVFPGQQWGSLTVLYEGETHITPSGNTPNRWVCKCICGEVISVLANSLKNRPNISCGCGGNIAPNQRFGLLKTLRKGKPYMLPNKMKKTAWICECTCGIITYVRANNLLTGRTTSCGCKTTSRLEDAVERSLNRWNIYYKREYKPEALAKRGFYYRLDFYLPDYNLNIEADGRNFHGGGHRNRSSEEQIEHDDNRNRRVSWFFGCYILRLSEDLLDGNPKHLDAKLRKFLDDMGEKPQYWLTYDFKTPC